MNIMIKTDHNIDGHQALSDQISGVVEGALNRFSNHITRVKVHLSEENDGKNGQNDMRCMMEVRLEGQQPITVTHHAKTLDQTVAGAADKLTGIVDSTLNRQRDLKRRRTDPSQFPEDE